MRAALAHLLERAEGAARSRFSARWPSSGLRRRGSTARSCEAALEVDLVVGVGELARGYSPDEWVATAADAVEARAAACRPGDAILVKGSRSVGLEVVADALLEPRP